jgi:hypothetical protein
MSLNFVLYNSVNNLATDMLKKGKQGKNTKHKGQRRKRRGMMINSKWLASVTRLCRLWLMKNYSRPRGSLYSH